MQGVNMTDLENMSPEELTKLQSMIQVAQSKQKLGEKYKIHKAIESVVETCKLPDQYHDMILGLKDKDEDVIISSILEHDTILRFPTLMALACFLPCSEIQIRCGLVELFDSYVYHSDYGLIVSNIAPFDVDRVLRNCRSHDPSLSRSSLEEFYRKLIGVLNSPSSEGALRPWIKKCLDDITFMVQVITCTNLPLRFVAALKFMSRDNEICDLNDPKAHAGFVDKFLETGADLIYARRISEAFKL